LKSIAGTLAAPFPYFGGKANACETVWQAFGIVENYVEPFAGSAAMLLGAPDGKRVETLNDADGFVANFWRAVSHDPASVADAADWPTNEADLFARHSWLIRQRDGLLESLHADPEFYDAKIAGWWCWGACNWIGSGWCSGTGPWVHDGGRIVDNRKLPHLGDAGRGASAPRSAYIHEWMALLHTRLRDVRVTCGDWQRVVKDSVTTRHGLTGLFLAGGLVQRKPARRLACAADLGRARCAAAGHSREREAHLRPGSGGHAVPGRAGVCGSVHPRRHRSGCRHGAGLGAGRLNQFCTARVAPEEAAFRPALPLHSQPGSNGTTMTKMTYGEQLKHPFWQRRRLEVLQAADWQCSNCGAGSVTLHVHHKQYIKGRMAWDYSLEELAALCENCHQDEHAAAECLKRLLAVADVNQVLALVGGFLTWQEAVDFSDIEFARQAAPLTYAAGVVAFLADSLGDIAQIRDVGKLASELAGPRSDARERFNSARYEAFGEDLPPSPSDAKGFD
jgi:hypothetical protein